MLYSGTSSWGMKRNSPHTQLWESALLRRSREQSLPGTCFSNNTAKKFKKKIQCNSFWGYASLHAIIVYLANGCLLPLWLFKAGVSWDSWLLLHSKTGVKLRFQYKQKVPIEERASTLFGQQGKLSVHLCFTCKTLQVSQPQAPAACIHVLPCHQHVASSMTTHQL